MKYVASTIFQSNTVTPADSGVGCVIGVLVRAFAASVASGFAELA